MDEILFNPIKSLFQVNFQDHIGFSALYSLKMIDILLDNNGIIRSPSVGQKASLSWLN